MYMYMDLSIKDLRIKDTSLIRTLSVVPATSRSVQYLHVVPVVSTVEGGSNVYMYIQCSS